MSLVCSMREQTKTNLICGLFLHTKQRSLRGMSTKAASLHSNETVIFPFMKTLTTLNFKLLPTNHRVPPSRRLINNTCHHPFAIHVTLLPPITSQKGYHSDSRLPWMYHCSKNTIVWQYPSYADTVGDPQERCYCLIKQLGTRKKQDNNDVVVGTGHEAWTGTRQQGDGAMIRSGVPHQQSNKLRKEGSSTLYHFNSKILSGDLPWPLPSI